MLGRKTTNAALRAASACTLGLLLLAGRTHSEMVGIHGWGRGMPRAVVGGYTVRLVFEALSMRCSASEPRGPSTLGCP